MALTTLLNKYFSLREKQFDLLEKAYAEVTQIEDLYLKGTEVLEKLDELQQNMREFSDVVSEESVGVTEAGDFYNVDIDELQHLRVDTTVNKILKTSEFPSAEEIRSLLESYVNVCNEQGAIIKRVIIASKKAYELYEEADAVIEEIGEQEDLEFVSDVMSEIERTLLDETDIENYLSAGAELPELGTTAASIAAFNKFVDEMESDDEEEE